MSRGQLWDLPVPVLGDSVRARVLRPREILSRLAITTRQVLPSAFLYSVGISKESTFAAAYPACTYPCQRFGIALAGATA